MGACFTLGSTTAFAGMITRPLQPIPELAISKVIAESIRRRFARMEGVRQTGEPCG